MKTQKRMNNTMRRDTIKTSILLLYQEYYLWLNFGLFDIYLLSMSSFSIKIKGLSNKGLVYS